MFGISVAEWFKMCCHGVVFCDAA